MLTKFYVETSTLTSIRRRNLDLPLGIVYVWFLLILRFYLVRQLSLCYNVQQIKIDIKYKEYKTILHLFNIKKLGMPCYILIMMILRLRNIKNEQKYYIIIIIIITENLTSKVPPFDVLQNSIWSWRYDTNFLICNIFSYKTSILLTKLSCNFLLFSYGF